MDSKCKAMVLFQFFFFFFFSSLKFQTRGRFLGFLPVSRIVHLVQPAWIFYHVDRRIRNEFDHEQDISQGRP